MLATFFASNGPLIVALILFVILLVIIIANIRIVPQASVYVIERLGTFSQEWHTGPHFLIPFMDRVAKVVTIKEQVVDFKPQPVITKDNVTMQIDTVVFFAVTDAKQYTYGVERPMAARVGLRPIIPTTAVTTGMTASTTSVSFQLVRNMTNSAPIM